MYRMYMSFVGFCFRLKGLVYKTENNYNCLFTFKSFIVLSLNLFYLVVEFLLLKEVLML